MPPDPVPGLIEDFSDRRVTVMGLGLSGGGLGSARFFCRAGARVTVTDLRGEKELAESITALAGCPVSLRLGGHRVEDFTGADLVIASPAVPPDAHYLKVAADSGVRIESALTLFFRWCPARIAGVTGTLGKTTITSLMGCILSGSGTRSWVGGNIGRNPLDFIGEIGSDDLVVLEISSFQLEYLGPAGLSPHVAVVTGISPDHMDRYSSMEEYAEAKRHILRHQRAGDIAFLNAGYPDVLGWARDSAGEVYRYGTDGEDLDVCVRDGEVLFRGEPIASVSDLKIGGRHNVENAAAAAAVCSRLGTGRETIDRGLSSFGGVAHRFEYVARIGEVTFYDDSAATTPPSVIAALGAAERPIGLILGGYDKGLDVSSLIPACVENVERVVLIGDSTAALSRMFGERAGGYRETHVTTAESMEEAVRTAAGALSRGSVLLSPGYASFDMFRNYRERGGRFKEAVHSLASSNG